MKAGFFGIPLLAWGGVCLVLAVVWVIFWPAEQATGTTGLRLGIIRWGHSLVWALAAICLIKAFGNEIVAGWGNLVRFAALAVYLAFMAASFTR